MPDIAAGAQIFDLVFHPSHSTVYSALLTGHIQAFSYDSQGNHQQIFSLRPSKRSCRALAINEDGSQLYAGGKSKALNVIDTTTQNIEVRAGTHESPINRIKHLMPWLLATGDDDGVIKLWDPRQTECIRTYKQHFDYITDFLWLDDKKHLVATSGDGTLSVMDVRSKNLEPVAQSEDQEDELLSIVAIKGGKKVVVGTQLGILSIFNRAAGWGDCVDRVPGHPHSVDALCALPSGFPDVDTASTILTGSSDGFVRAVHILPTKLSGVVADHGDWPVERIAIGTGLQQLTLQASDSVGDDENRFVRTVEDSDAEEQNQKDTSSWVGSVGHDERLKLTDLEAFFRENPTILAEDEDECGHSDSADEESTLEPEQEHVEATLKVQPVAQDSDPDNSDAEPEPRKRKRKKEKNPLSVKKKGKNIAESKSFFDGL